MFHCLNQHKIIVVCYPPMRPCWVLPVIDYNWAAAIFEEPPKKDVVKWERFSKKDDYSFGVLRGGM